MPSFYDLPIEDKTGPHSLIAGPITEYLEGRYSKAINEKVLQEMLAMLKHSIVRQLMQPREDRAGRESNTLYSFPCARKSQFIFNGKERAPLSARAMLKFLLGDFVETAVMGIARLAGLDIGCNNVDLTVKGLDGKLIPVHPDGLLHSGDKAYNVEIKSCDSRTFDSWLANGGPDDKWGYDTQQVVEQEAWNQSDQPVVGTVFVAVSTGTRQGSIAEWVLPFKQVLLDEWHARRSIARQPTLPPVPFKTEQETKYVKGKAVEAVMLSAALQWGEPVEKKDKNGKTHGWELPTGRQLVNTVCSYCDFLHDCYEGAQQEIDRGRPIWVVPPKPSPLFGELEQTEEGVFVPYTEGGPNDQAA